MKQGPHFRGIIVKLGIRAVHNERELLKEVVLGREKAFAKLFYAYHNQLGEYVLLLTNSEEMTEEIVQDVFVKIWLNREVLLKVDNFTSYLFILTRNYTLNCIRKLVRDRTHQEQYGKELLTEELNTAETEGRFTDGEYQSMINRAIAQLPPQQQKVFMLRQKGLKNPEIAKQMNISTDSVKKYQQWALKSVTEFVKTHAALSVFIAFVQHRI